MNDDELRERFGELKKRDARTAPAFEKLVAKRPKSRAPLLIALSPFRRRSGCYSALVWRQCHRKEDRDGAHVRGAAVAADSC